jgi:hypothetical protein
MSAARKPAVIAARASSRSGQPRGRKFGSKAMRAPAARAAASAASSRARAGAARIESVTPEK